MRKIFCDSCGQESKKVNMNVFEVPCHLFSKTGNVNDGHYDDEGNPISGRKDSIDLCNKCCNTAYSAALKALESEFLNEIRNK